MFRISTLWAAVWLIFSLPLAVRLYSVRDVEISLARFVTIVVPRCAAIGFGCGIAFSVLLLSFGRRGRRHIGVRFGAPIAALAVGALASPRVGLDPPLLSAFVFGVAGLASASLSLAVSDVETQRV